MACQNPTGIVTAHGQARAYVNCWVTRNLAIVDLAAQSLAGVVASSDPPASGSLAEDQNRGRRFYFTGRGRWSLNAWSSCGSCHPDGLTDNVTWSFGAGPRQTTSMDGSFSHGPGPQKQRILNWTGIFDEMHDFERNTRGTSGGLGALTTAPPGGCGNLAMETPQSLAPGGTAIGGLQKPLKELQLTANNCTTDWDDVNEFAKTIRPPRARRGLAPADVTAGQALFTAGGCNKCHGGPGWTASRLYWTPSESTNNTLLPAAPLVKPSGWFLSWNNHVNQVEVQQIQAGVEAATIAPPQVSCVIRDLDTFGIPGDVAGTNSLEVKDTGTRAQGAGGYNVPSLYGLAVGAPYLHHGQAATLEELFSDPAWLIHMQAGNQVFFPNATEQQQLIAFLLSIDADTTEMPLPTDQEGCPATFP
jgi:cytochrome c peroxidase